MSGGGVDPGHVLLPVHPDLLHLFSCISSPTSRFHHLFSFNFNIVNRKETSIPMFPERYRTSQVPPTDLNNDE